MCLMWRADKFKNRFCSNLTPFTEFKFLFNVNTTTPNHITTSILRMECYLIHLNSTFQFLIPASLIIACLALVALTGPNIKEWRITLVAQSHLASCVNEIYHLSYVWDKI